jgi:hypothetical protein
MKKILSVCLGIFIAVFLGGSLNMLFAQEEVNEVGVSTKKDCLMGV